ncbi:tRNA (adenosine(37)-N6)-threonylcarbamoyltransferase complex transferase subunit TsaD [Caproiciproducens faecalis]|uniref:N(6)-L-threonylcarbamoyladenine synthase n=1 Tax=Caproiciproducens faecalis TaxID=2820301 RepID=A0ABS7DRP8_9FIRM|nr:peptidase M22 [Caproiciproducens faecalis]MBW7573470.1 peptidase M22 [Caproiciproducens faecalis]
MKQPIDTLGIDTSNYTTSAALLQNGAVFQQKMLLPVKQGELGLRQSDAVFHHVQQLPQVLETLIQDKLSVGAVGVSDRPRDLEGSYMPCFTVGYGTGKAIALSLGVPFYTFSHQAGHIAAALYSAGKLNLLHEKFIAFHVSGGTTEAVLVTPDEKAIFSTRIIARSLDLKGGQAVDRVGAMLGLAFPSGKALEQLALQTDKAVRVKPSLKGADCSLSGVENRCADMLKKGMPKEEIAAYCLYSILAALDGMTAELLKQYGNLPLLFAGGVMSNSLIRSAMTEKYGAAFAAPEFSADNAAGIAVLTSIKGA